MVGVLAGFACELNHFPDSTGPGQGEGKREREEGEELQGADLHGEMGR